MGATADIATGAPIGRAVASHAGEAREEPHSSLCLNCGTRLIGEHCHACGQSGHVHRTFGAIGHELAHGVFHFEGRIWRTLPMLTFRPGELTRRYIAGERARFVSPLALFLFIIFVVFAMLSVVGAHLEAPGYTIEQRGEAGVAIKRQIARESEKLAVTTKQRAAATDAAEIERLDDRIAAERRQINVLQTSYGMVEMKRGADAIGNLHTGWKRLDKGLGKAAENPNLMLYKIQSNAYKFAWALIPLSLPFMWLLFPFSRRFKMYDHAIFITYSLSFVMLLGMTLGVLLALAGAMAAPGAITGLLWTAAILIVPIHIYKQLRGAYGLSRASAFVRAFVLYNLATVAITLFILLLLGLGLTG